MNLPDFQVNTNMGLSSARPTYVSLLPQELRVELAKYVHREEPKRVGRSYRLDSSAYYDSRRYWRMHWTELVALDACGHD